MCITSGPAELSKTKIMSFPLESGRHMFAYQNSVKGYKGGSYMDVFSFLNGDQELDKVGKKRDFSGPNSMILPIPGKVKEEWFYDTSNYNEFLDDIEKWHKPKGRSLELKSRGVYNSVQADVFENGMYTIVVSKSADAILDAVKTLPENKIPEIKKELLDFFEIYYKGFSFVVCCFDGNKEMKSQPIMFEYEPTHPNYLFFPGMDSHDGGAPKVGEYVKTDHVLITDCPWKDVNQKFTQQTPLILERPYVTFESNDFEPNCDWFSPITTSEKRVDFNRTYLYKVS